MLGKINNYLLMLIKRKDFVFFLILISVGFSNKINLEKNSRLVFEESYYQ